MKQSSSSTSMREPTRCRRAHWHVRLGASLQLSVPRLPTKANIARRIAFDGGGSVGARVAVIYYSATGNVHGLAHAVAEGAEQAGAEVRLRHVEELAS